MSVAEAPGDNTGLRKRPVRWRRRVVLGCLLPGLVVCSGPVLLAGWAAAGHSQIGLPGNTTLNFGHDAFVLSNYSFQNGATYYADLSGNQVRNILEVHLLSDAHKLEIVLHHATKDVEQEDHLVDVPVP